MAEAAIDRHLAAARRRIGTRVRPEHLAQELQSSSLIVDIRPLDLRLRDGELPQAVTIERNVLEWRLDPSSSAALPGFDDHGRRVVLVCDEGYASSLAAAGLRDLGLTNVTDLAGGFQAWRSVAGPQTAAGQPHDNERRR